MRTIYKYFGASCLLTPISIQYNKFKVWSMPIKCIICNNEGKIIRNKSFMKKPVAYCNNCDLYYAKGTDEEFKKSCSKYYTKNYWGKFHKKYTERYLLNFIISLLRLLGTKSSLHTWHYNLIKKYTGKKQLIDIGHGKGESLRYFHSINFEIRGVDADKNNVKKLNKYFKKDLCEVCNIEEKSIKGKYDIFYMTHVLEHLTRPDLFLQRLGRNFRRDSILFIEVPNCENRKLRHGSIVGNPHIYHFTPTSLSLLLAKNGYTLLKIATYNEITRSRIKMFLRMIFRISNYEEAIHGSKLIVLATSMMCK